MEEIVSEYHIPVLYRECIDNLVINKDGVYLDCTLGGGGHSEGILKELSDKGRLISIDQDDQAIEFAKKRLEKYGAKWKVFKNNFENLDIVLYSAGYDKIDGILMDIGVSSTQLDDPSRGFSYRYDTKLDMRMNQNSELSAYDVVNNYSEEDLARIIYEYGEERNSRRIARLICEERAKNKIETTGELVAIIKRAYPERAQKHPAKKTFQAIRIEVNRELEVLDKAIDKAVDALKPGGRLGIITFHSLEDRLVKNKFRDLATACKCPPELPVCICGGKAKVKLITRKPIVPQGEEVKFNNRAHSSKLRVVERI
ncbi:Ribosomal RNA small subunit methyltransferase H [Fusobacterium sp. DD29]|uniref:16S rRNA (cytosine(1402)-N(4))-methyltransferase RsmH n=1 Tax=unclassified Fusobacterium TaxID=2648384 RepID=UPI001B8B8556|nr:MULTISPECIES: 16S rRNA (cytosine(1402)-N(4))-methyltransferase RsmH [unclassified Fusobacterium]MBR8700706.1 Ribosomal RNA small subunit methyltransferase H [Fusobacterium sp. DD45]MBR8710454.1 Ribosomal RNA small subunit methyltransferase H [Fusobacterium sp. DD28]MBR8749873.1 Ribosomal RNA small subunit methyltransferase H [Fusobacterium sp. DD29]MBR8750996.1 Ribosomal RNA small subunit methyltransferase H [Fusobacterium sp. DD26]MBR8762115.1 Ribosomal RNA small subunit methyltransferase 